MDVVHDPGPWIRVGVLVDARVAVSAEQPECRHVRQVSCERTALTPSASNIGLSFERASSLASSPVNRSYTSGWMKVCT